MCMHTYGFIVLTLTGRICKVKYTKATLKLTKLLTHSPSTGMFQVVSMYYNFDMIPRV